MKFELIDFILSFVMFAFAIVMFAVNVIIIETPNKLLETYVSFGVVILGWMNFRRAYVVFLNSPVKEEKS